MRAAVGGPGTSIMAPAGNASAMMMGAYAAVPAHIETAIGGVGIAVVDEARTYMDRIVAAAVVVGIIVVAIARGDGHIGTRDIATIFDLDQIFCGAVASAREERPGRCRIAGRRTAQECGREQPS